MNDPRLLFVIVLLCSLQAQAQGATTTSTHHWPSCTSPEYDKLHIYYCEVPKILFQNIYLVVDNMNSEGRYHTQGVIVNYLVQNKACKQRNSNGTRGNCMELFIVLGPKLREGAVVEVYALDRNTSPTLYRTQLNLTNITGEDKIEDSEMIGQNNNTSDTVSQQQYTRDLALALAICLVLLVFATVIALVQSVMLLHIRWKRTSERKKSKLMS